MHAASSVNCAGVCSARWKVIPHACIQGLSNRFSPFSDSSLDVDPHCSAGSRQGGWAFAVLATSLFSVRPTTRRHLVPPRMSGPSDGADPQLAVQSGLSQQRIELSEKLLAMIEPSALQYAEN